MKWFGSALLFVSLLLPADAEPPWAQALPEVVATVDGRPIGRTETIRLVEKRYGDQSPPSRLLKLYVQQALQDEFCRIAITRKLAEAGIDVTEEQAFEFYRNLEKLKTPALRRPEAELRAAAAEPDSRLQLAVRLYLHQTQPEKLQVTESAVEDFYRRNQALFQPATQVVTRMIRTRRNPAGRAAIEAAESELRQGADWNRTAEKTDDPSLGPPPLRELAEKDCRPEVGRLSPVLELTDEYVLLKREERPATASYTLEQAREHIRQLLIERQVAGELEKLITAELGEMNIQYHW